MTRDEAHNKYDWRGSNEDPRVDDIIDDLYDEFESKLKNTMTNTEVYKQVDDTQIRKEAIQLLNENGIVAPVFKHISDFTYIHVHVECPLTSKTIKEIVLSLDEFNKLPPATKKSLLKYRNYNKVDDKKAAEHNELFKIELANYRELLQVEINKIEQVKINTMNTMNTMNAMLLNLNNVSRVEVIGKTGREFVARSSSKYDISLQDDNRTIKFFEV